MNKNLIAVYGSLKQGFFNHSLLENSKFLGTFKTNPEYTMYSLYSFPAIIKGGNTSIHVEIYEIDLNTLKAIYILEGYSGIRNSPENWYDTLELDTPFGKAEMFYMKGKIKGLIIESGNWKN